jgi:hypothetical protein
MTLASGRKKRVHIHAHLFFKITYVALVKASLSIFSKVFSALPQRAVVEQKPDISGFYNQSTYFQLSSMHSVSMAKLLGRTKCSTKSVHSFSQIRGGYNMDKSGNTFTYNYTVCKMTAFL